MCQLHVSCASATIECAPLSNAQCSRRQVLENSTIVVIQLDGENDVRANLRRPIHTCCFLMRQGLQILLPRTRLHKLLIFLVALCGSPTLVDLTRISVKHVTKSRHDSQDCGCLRTRQGIPRFYAQA